MHEGIVCHSCGTPNPIIECTERGFMYHCRKAECHANLGPVHKQAPAAAPAPQTAPVPIQASVAVPASSGVERLILAPAGDSILDRARARLAELDDIVPGLVEEREQLRRMLKAASRSSRRRPSNVVPITPRAEHAR